MPTATDQTRFRVYLGALIALTLLVLADLCFLAACLRG